MTPEDLESAWTRGLPERGTFRLTIPMSRQNASPLLFEVVGESMKMLAETISEAMSLIEPGFVFELVPSETHVPTWDVAFMQPQAATDVLALALTAFYHLAIDREAGELFTNVAVDHAPDVPMLPHRRLLPLPALPEVRDEATGGPVTNFADVQGYGVELSFDTSADDDPAALDKVAMAVSNLIEAGCFDIPGSPPEWAGMVEPFVGHLPDEGRRTIGVRGLRGDGLAIRWLSAMTAHTLGHPLPAPRVTLFPDDR